MISSTRRRLVWFITAAIVFAQVSHYDTCADLIVKGVGTSGVNAPLVSFGAIDDDTSSAMYLSATNEITMTSNDGEIWVNDLTRTPNSLEVLVNITSEHIQFDARIADTATGPTFLDYSDSAQLTATLGIPTEGYNTTGEQYIHRWSGFSSPVWETYNNGYVIWSLAGEHNDTSTDGLKYATGARTWIATFQWLDTPMMQGAPSAILVALMNKDSNQPALDALMIAEGTPCLVEKANLTVAYHCAEQRVDDGRWHIIAITRNAFAGYPGSIWRIYVDGTLQSSWDASNSTLVTGLTWADYDMWTTGAGGFAWDGRLARIMSLDIELTATQVEAYTRQITYMDECTDTACGYASDRLY